MTRDLYMLGLIVRDMAASLEFYRRLGLDIPDDSAGKTHVEVKMGTGLTFFLDSRPSRWDPSYVQQIGSEHAEAPDDYRSILEFYVNTQAEVDALYNELTGFGYQSHRAPYTTSFGMYFAMIKDPDGNIILLSGEPEAA